MNTIDILLIVLGVVNLAYTFLSRSKKPFIVITLLLITGVGCVRDTSIESNEIAYISVDTKSKHQKTFEELNLGIIFDYNLKLPRSDESWVKLWIEGYSEGEQIKPELSVLEYGQSLNQEEEGNIGVGIINPNNDERQVFLYGPSVSITPHTIDQDIFLTEGISSWDYAMDKKQVVLAPGEEKILAVYRQSAGNMNAYSYEDLKSIEKMIQEDAVVILLKIKIDEIAKQ